MLQLQSAFGIVALLAIAWALGENRRAVSLKQAALGLMVTILTAVVLLKVPAVARAFGAINDAVGAISQASRAGTSFVFGYVGGGALPFDLKAPGADFVLVPEAPLERFPQRRSVAGIGVETVDPVLVHEGDAGAES